MPIAYNPNCEVIVNGPDDWVHEYIAARERKEPVFLMPNGEWIEIIYYEEDEKPVTKCPTCGHKHERIRK